MHGNGAGHSLNLALQTQGAHHQHSRGVQGQPTQARPWGPGPERARAHTPAPRAPLRRHRARPTAAHLLGPPGGQLPRMPYTLSKAL